jgi:hypothetical protein
MELPPLPDPLARLNASASAAESARAGAQARAVSVRLAGMTQQLIKVPDPGTGGSDNYMTYGENAGMFGADNASFSFQVLQNSPEAGKFRLAYGTINGEIAVNANAVFTASNAETWAWGKLRFDPAGRFLAWTIETGNKLPPRVIESIPPYGVILVAAVPLAVVFKGKRSISGAHNLQSSNTYIQPTITNIDAVQAEWTMFYL